VAEPKRLASRSTCYRWKAVFDSWAPGLNYPEHNDDQGLEQAFEYGPASVRQLVSAAHLHPPSQIPRSDPKRRPRESCSCKAVSTGLDEGGTPD
jgi:hypothetical protein